MEKKPARPFCILIFFSEENPLKAPMTNHEFVFTLLPLTVKVCERLLILSDFNSTGAIIAISSRL